MESDLKIICLESSAFYELVDQVVEKLRKENNATDEVWIDTEDALNLLKISSKTTLQKLRNEGKVKYSQPMKKHILYFKPSLLDYLEKNSKDTF